VLLTGMSGAGHSTALGWLEDMGFEAVDNLPLDLVRLLLKPGELPERPLAISIDSRTRGFSADSAIELIDELAARPDLDVTALFIDCEEATLQQRFTETRRRHPLATDRPVLDGIVRERALLEPLRRRADMLIDTSELSVHDLRRILQAQFGVENAQGFHLNVMSFSYRRGLPREADLVFDVRFLANPHYDPELRPMTGQSDAVKKAVEADPDFPGFFETLTRLLHPLLPRYRLEGKSYLTLAAGCTGGKHRSVVVAEKLADWLRTQQYEVTLTHRDIPQLAVVQD
jgi:UPF0042 nucleotide-binding protein